MESKAEIVIYETTRNNETSYQLYFIRYRADNSILTRFYLCECNFKETANRIAGYFIKDIKEKSFEDVTYRIV